MYVCAGGHPRLSCYVIVCRCSLLGPPANTHNYSATFRCTIHATRIYQGEPSLRLFVYRLAEIRTCLNEQVVGIMCVGVNVVYHHVRMVCPPGALVSLGRRTHLRVCDSVACLTDRKTQRNDAHILLSLLAHAIVRSSSCVRVRFVDCSVQAQRIKYRCDHAYTGVVIASLGSCRLK